MIQFDLPRVACSRPQRSEFRMVAVEVPNIADIFHPAGLTLQISVTLRATRIPRAGETNGALVLKVARAASGSERGLLRVMRGSIVALQAGGIRYFVAEYSCLRDVTNLAALAEYRMRKRKWSATVDFLPGCALRYEPSECHNGDRYRKPQAPAAKRMRSREILQVDPLGQRFGCAYASHIRKRAERAML